MNFQPLGLGEAGDVVANSDRGLWHVLAFAFIGPKLWDPELGGKVVTRATPLCGARPFLHTSWNYLWAQLRVHHSGLCRSCVLELLFTHPDLFEKVTEKARS